MATPMAIPRTITQLFKWFIICFGVIVLLAFLQNYREKKIQIISKHIKEIITGKSIKMCPVPSPLLTGEYSISLEVKSLNIMENTFTWLENGGHQKPTDCVPRQKVAIIVPYRNRSDHLHIFLNNIHPLLRKQMYDTTLFIVEQAEGSKFNRAVLLNIGFVEAEKSGGFDCYIFHDVDKIPENDRNIFNCSDKPRHMVLRNTHKYKLGYAGYIGGAISMSKDGYKQINGMSNCYSGWGGEDDNMLERLKREKLGVWRFENKINHYRNIPHERDKGNEFNKKKGSLTKNWSSKYKIDGLSSLRYTRLSLDRNPLFTRIYVTFNKTTSPTCPNWS